MYVRSSLKYRADQPTDPIRYLTYIIIDDDEAAITHGSEASLSYGYAILDDRTHFCPAAAELLRKVPFRAQIALHHAAGHLRLDAITWHASKAVAACKSAIS